MTVMIFGDDCDDDVHEVSVCHQAIIMAVIVWYIERNLFVNTSVKWTNVTFPAFLGPCRAAWFAASTYVNNEMLKISIHKAL